MVLQCMEDELKMPGLGFEECPGWAILDELVLTVRHGVVLDSSLRICHPHTTVVSLSFSKYWQMTATQELRKPRYV